MSAQIGSAGLSICCFIAIAACNQATPAQEGRPKPRVPTATVGWKAAAGDSLVSVNRFHGLETARRCWRREGAYDCAYVTSAGGWHPAHRYQVPDVGGPAEEDLSAPTYLSGYSCSFLDDGVVKETIGDQERYRKTNTFDLRGNVSGKPWTAEQVATFMRAAGADRHKSHFDCAELAGQVLDGGMQAIASPDISFDQLMK